MASRPLDAMSVRESQANCIRWPLKAVSAGLFPLGLLRSTRASGPGVKCAAGAGGPEALPALNDHYRGVIGRCKRRWKH
jgi:hypothetical protein